MSLILLIYKHANPEAGHLAEEIKIWLERRDHAVSVTEVGSEIPARSYNLAVVLGGDGAMLGAGRKFAGSDTKILGINFGHVGFLCATSPEKWREALEKALKGYLYDFSFMALKWRLQHNGEEIDTGVSVNDIALTRGALARLAKFDVSINNEKLGVLRGDGLICCTPLGSSAYSISAGGPLIWPDLNIIGFTPICPFLTNVTPMIFPLETRFTFEILEGSAECFLTIDGQEGRPLENGDIVCISGWKSALHFLTLSPNFLHKLPLRGLALEK